MTDIDFLSLKHWFLDHRRDLPWRENPTPYAVWVSEVMLQQTQVAVVIPYFERWMELFPTIESLANAKEERVIKAWEGLGYYSRARNLHAGAKYVLENFQGSIPAQTSDLEQIKGLGPYTIGAIQSFAFHQKTPAVDGNVMRVIARYQMLEEDIAKQKTVKDVRQWILERLPDDASWLVNEGLIELGATVCKRKPDCAACPLRKGCISFRHGRQEQLPIKGNRTPSIPLHRIVPVIHCEGHYLVRKGKEGEIMQGLHEFPYFETELKDWKEEATVQQVEMLYGLRTSLKQALPSVKHTFTKYRVSLSPYLLQANTMKVVEAHDWKPLKELKKLAFSSGHRRIFDYIRSA